jgi:hypothetical protein
MEQHIGQPEEQNQQEKLVSQIFYQAKTLVEEYGRDYVFDSKKKFVALDFSDSTDLRKSNRIIVQWNEEKNIIDIHYNQQYSKDIMLNTQVGFSPDRIMSFSADTLCSQGGNFFVDLPFNNPSEEAKRIMGKQWSEKEKFHGKLDLNLINKLLTEGKVLQIQEKKGIKKEKKPLISRLKRIIGR